MKMSQFGSKKELQGTAVWRDVVAEFFGTFMLMSVQCALPLSWTDQSLPPLTMGLHTGVGMGFVVCSMAWMCADFGGGHLNPAVTFAMATCGKISIPKGIFFILSQCAGAMAGAAFVFSVTPEEYREGLAATTLHPAVSPWQGFLIEMWITALLVLTVFGATNSSRKQSLFMPTIPIGFAVALGIMSAFASTGGSMNPARSLGPAVVMNIWADHWVYWVGPLVGGTLASAIYNGLDYVSRPAAHQDIATSSYTVEEYL